MKRLFNMVMLMLVFSTASFAQKFAVVDMQYILKNIPSYERANTQLEQMSKQWQAEIEAKGKEAQALYKSYQTNADHMTEAQKAQKEEAIINKEKEASDLKRKYFAPEGEMYRQRASMVTPIQEMVVKAVEEVGKAKGYSLVLDRASNAGVIYSSEQIDLSNEVLSKLGYSN